MATILLYESVPEAWFDDFAEFLRERQPEDHPLELVQADDTDLEGKLALLHKADAVVVGLTGQRRPLGREAIESAPRLRLIQKLGSRTAGVDLEAARQAGVSVSLLPSPHCVAAAEHTMLFILALARKLVAAHQRAVRKSPKDAGPPPRPASASDYAHNWAGIEGIRLVAGKVLGLVGMGDIAVETVRRAAAFGMRVVYCDSDPLPEDEEGDLGVERRELDDLLREADFVSLHVGLTPETQNLLNAERLALMKPTAFLVNAARGGLVDEAALADALANGRLAGAAIDAWAMEPTPKDNPLLKFDNVVATPHIAAGAFPTTTIFEELTPNLIAALRGEAVAGCLTPDVEPKPPLAPEEPQEEPPAAEESAGEEAPPSEDEAPEAPPAEEEEEAPPDEESPEKPEATRDE